MNESNREQRQYHFKIEGHIDARWQDWFDGLAITSTADGHTILSGSIRDQAALYGVFKKISNLGMTLISVNPQIPDKKPNAPTWKDRQKDC